jgi:PAS domain S-box-containing protein
VATAEAAAGALAAGDVDVLLLGRRGGVPVGTDREDREYPELHDVIVVDLGSGLGEVEIEASADESAHTGTMRLGDAVRGALRLAETKLRRADTSRHVGLHAEAVRAAFDSVASSIVVLDRDGVIVFANRRWEEGIFARENPDALSRTCGTGASYYEACRRATDESKRDACAVLAGIEEVQSGARDGFSHEYCCEQDGRKWWGVVVVTPFGAPREGVVVVHDDITRFKLVEESLRASEAKYRIVAENTFGWEFWMSPEGRFLYVSPACETITGHPAEAFARDPELLVRLLHPDDRERYAQHRHSATEGEQEEEFEFRIVRDDGSVRWIAHRCAPIFDESGGHVGARGSNRDITTRKRTEVALAAEASRRRALVEGSLDGIVVLSGDGRVYEANRRFAEMLGYTPEEAAELQVSDWDPAWSPERAAEALRTLGPEGSRFETRHRRKDGSFLDVEVSNNVAEIDGRRFAFCICHDVTARKRALAALAEREEIFSKIVSQAVDAITVLDANTLRFVEFNAAAHEGLGYERENFSRLSVREIQAEHEDVQIRRNVEAALAGGTVVFETLHRHRDGSLRNVRVSLRSLNIPDRNYLAAVWTDITAMKRAGARAARDALRTEFLLELHRKEPSLSDRELYDYVLDRAVEMTSSEIGFFHRISEDQQTILLTTWNAGALETCRAAFDSHYPLRDAGNWVECVRQQRPIVYNDFASSPHQRGLPHGHTPVRRFMSIPVIRDGKVRIIFGVGNKPSDYDEGDVEQIQVVANELHKVMAKRASELQVRRLSQAVEQSTVSVVITDAEGAIEYVNPKFCETSGYTREEVLGTNPRVLKGSEVADETYRTLWEELRAGRPWRGEVHNRRKDGTHYWEAATISPITDSGGRITHYVAVMEDVTERKRLESFRSVLLGLGQQLNQTRDAAEVGRAVLDVAARFCGWDAATFDVLDGDAARPRCILKVETIDGGVREFSASDDHGAEERVRRALVRGGRVLAVEGHDPFPGLGGGDLACVACVPVERGHRIVGLFALGSRRTGAYSSDDLEVLQALGDYCGGALERIRSEEAMRTSEARYRALIEASFDWIWETDADGRYTFASPRVAQLLGYTPEEVLGLTPFDLMPAAEGAKAAVLFAESRAQRAPFTAVLHPTRHKDGRLVTLESSGVPMCDQEGRFVGYRGMDRDVSERKRLEEQFRQAQKLEAVGQLAGGVAHDFNNILAAMMMQIGVAGFNERLDDEVKQLLGELSGAVQRAAGLTRQLLMFSRRSVLKVVPLDVREIVRNLLKMLVRLIGEQNELRFESDPDLPLVEADAGMLEQVVMNLVVNARDAMPRGGRIHIRTRTCVFGEAETEGRSVRRAGCFVRIEVADTGVGMSAETLSRVFEPFFTTKEPGRGTGLGLATVHGIVAQHRGWVEVESAEDCGTTFSVHLPAMTEPAVVESPREAGVALPKGRETILLVEDDADVRQMLRVAISGLGYRVHAAGNGIEALKLWQALGDRFDLVLTDMVMPEGMTGLELVERLRELKPGLKAILTSGYSLEIVRGDALKQAGVAYLPKPYDAAKLAEVLRDCLDTRERR